MRLGWVFALQHVFVVLCCAHSEWVAVSVVCSIFKNDVVRNKKTLDITSSVEFDGGVSNGDDGSGVPGKRGALVIRARTAVNRP